MIALLSEIDFLFKLQQGLVRIGIKTFEWSSGSPINKYDFFVECVEN